MNFFVILVLYSYSLPKKKVLPWNCQSCYNWLCGTKPLATILTAKSGIRLCNCHWLRVSILDSKKGFCYPVSRTGCFIVIFGKYIKNFILAGYMGFFITVEGIEGCGKTTQIELIDGYLKKSMIPYIITREPGGTAVGEDIRKIFLHSDNSDILPLTELLLVNASRAQTVNLIIKPALEKGSVVVCDRFFDATVAYQGYAAGLSLSMINRCHELFMDSITPDLTILLDCPVCIGLTRSKARNKQTGIEKQEGRFEDKALEFHEKVRQGYIETAGRNPGRFEIIKTENSSVEKVFNQMCLIVESKLKEKGYAI